MAFPLSGSNSLRERLLGHMSDGPVGFKAPFGLELPNRLASTPALVQYLRELVQSGELNLGEGFGGEGPEVSLPGPAVSAPYKTRPSGRRPVARPGRSGRIGMQHRRARASGINGPRRRQRGETPPIMNRSRMRPSRVPVRRQRGQTPPIMNRRQTAPGTPTRRSSSYRISAPRSNAYRVRHNPRHPARASHAVLRYGRRRPIPMGVRRVEQTRTTRPSLTRFVGGVNPRSRYSLV